MKDTHTKIETGMLFQVWLSINLKCYVHPKRRYNCIMHTKKKGVINLATAVKHKLGILFDIEQF